MNGRLACYISCLLPERVSCEDSLGRRRCRRQVRRARCLDLVSGASRLLLGLKSTSRNTLCVLVSHILASVGRMDWLRPPRCRTVGPELVDSKGFLVAFFLLSKLTQSETCVSHSRLKADQRTQGRWHASINLDGGVTLPEAQCLGS